ncbi:uncharacterized protein N7484_001620 [Penicillium longicatenatum]|uniref:uncharacterized protein n=1 Tax=Penicillium longicatenatum TaxID=1561947 RepID=UPI0025467E2F|nr:uncharacterized protein N7484_001620 [Penicillium longicatenatum]KAJ5657971.1 hypothetical protein N7484_001620 [Penicillium longicatenatum]
MAEVPADPPSRAIGLPQILPAPITKVEDMGDGLEGEILGRLLMMHVNNEPVLRPGARAGWTATTFFTKINSLLANIEAILMQCVGQAITDPEEMCAHCRRRCGPFSFCVRVDGIEECANCHWEKLGHRCSFNASPLSPKTRQNSKLYTQEEIAAFEQEMEELRVAHASFVANARSQHSGLDRAGKHCRTAVRGNPDRVSTPLPPGVMAIRMSEYGRELQGPWLLDMEAQVGDLQTAHAELIDEALEIMKRLNALTKL